MDDLYKALGGNKLVYEFIISNYYNHTFAILYVLNLILLIIAYKLGFARKLPLLKSIFVYILLALGTVIVAIFAGIAELPTVESLVIVNLVLGVYRLRLHHERKVKNAN